MLNDICLKVHNKGSCSLFVNLILRFISFYSSLLMFFDKILSNLQFHKYLFSFVLYKSYRTISTASKRRPVRKVRFKLESVISGGHSTRTTYKNRRVKWQNGAKCKPRIVVKCFNRCKSDNDLIWQNWEKETNRVTVRKTLVSTEIFVKKGWKSVEINWHILFKYCVFIEAEASKAPNNVLMVYSGLCIQQQFLSKYTIL